MFEQLTAMSFEESFTHSKSNCICGIWGCGNGNECILKANLVLFLKWKFCLCIGCEILSKNLNFDTDLKRMLATAKIAWYGIFF